MMNNLGNQLQTANRYATFQSYSFCNEKPIVTSDAIEALLGEKLSNGITVDGCRGIVVSCERTPDQ
jgi:hypothetical protein